MSSTEAISKSWPSGDHRRCPATEVDLDPSPVGGPAAPVDALVDDPGLGVHRVPPGADLSVAGDDTDELVDRRR